MQKVLLILFLFSFPVSQDSRRISYPIKYSIGNIDSRFGIGKQKVSKLVKEAIEVWENAAKKKLFLHDPAAKLKIILVFDERQQRRNEAKTLRSKIDSRGKSFDILVKEHTSEQKISKKLEKDYETSLSTFTKKLDSYNATVTRWNSEGGAPKEVHSQLKRERTELDEMQKRLEAKRVHLNGVIDRVNNLVETINSLAAQYNIDVAVYNGRFVETREFEKGAFDGGGIYVYEFNDDSVLKLTLLHELGHALGLSHADDPEAIMFYKMEKQDLVNVRLTKEDRQLLLERLKRR